MQKVLILLVIVSFIFSGCKEKSKSADADFKVLSESFLTGYIAWRPQLGVYLGLHEYDGKLTDVSKESLAKELARLKEYDQKFSQIDTAALSDKTFFDLRILKNNIKTEIFNIEDLGGYTKNPMAYAGAIDVNIYVKRNYAPIEDRIRAIIEIENQAQTIFTNAKANLSDSLAKPYVETAIPIARGSAAFLSGDLVTALKDVKNDTLMSSFKAANKKAIGAINDFAAYLEKEKLPKVHTKYAIGRVNYQKMLVYNEGITLSPERVLEIGLSELKKEQEVFNAAAKIINPKRSRSTYMLICKRSIQQQKVYCRTPGKRLNLYVNIWSTKKL